MTTRSPVWISPHYTDDMVNLDSASIDDRIAIFEDRVRGYYTTPARLLANSYGYSGYLILLIVSMCVEWLEIFHIGESSKDKSGEYFETGFRQIFNPSKPSSISENQFEADLSRVLKELYYQVRCGLIHGGTTRSKVIINNQLSVPLEVDFDMKNGKIVNVQINPYLCLYSIDLYLSNYCTELRDPKNEEIRLKFNQAWDALAKE